MKESKCLGWFDILDPKKPLWAAGRWFHYDSDKRIFIDPYDVVLGKEITIEGMVKFLTTVRLQDLDGEFGYIKITTPEQIISLLPLLEL